MREASNPAEIYENGIFVGYNLSQGGCAEHERGIEGLDIAFGVTPPERHREVLGIERYYATRVPKTVRIEHFKASVNNINYAFAGLLVESTDYYRTLPSKDILNLFPKPYILDKTLKECYATWDENAFAISVPREREENLILMRESIFDRNVAIFTAGSSNPFAKRGLMIMIKNRIPSDIAEKAYQSHLYDIRLEDADAELNIDGYIKSHGKVVYSLYPKFTEESYVAKDTPTRYPLIYYVSTIDSKFQSGWHTVEEIMEWCERK